MKNKKIEIITGLQETRERLNEEIDNSILYFHMTEILLEVIVSNGMRDEFKTLIREYKKDDVDEIGEEFISHYEKAYDELLKSLDETFPDKDNKEDKATRELEREKMQNYLYFRYN